MKASSTKAVTREATEQKVIQRLVDMLPRARRETIAKGVKLMTGGELQIAARANVDKIRRLASGKPTVPRNGQYVNPFWYR